jgi:hypothetical protein
MRVSLDTTTAEFLGSFEPQLTQEPMITVTAHCPVCAENVQTAMPLEALSYAELKKPDHHRHLPGVRQPGIP